MHACVRASLEDGAGPMGMQIRIRIRWVEDGSAKIDTTESVDGNNVEGMSAPGLSMRQSRVMSANGIPHSS